MSEPVEPPAGPPPTLRLPPPPPPPGAGAPPSPQLPLPPSSPPPPPPPPVTTVEVGDGSPRRGRGAKIGVLVGVGALVAAGTFAIVKVTGNDDAGGAATPAAVGTQLFEALGNEDVLGVIDLLLPGERETFREPLVEFFDHLRRIEVLDSSASLNKVGGIDFEFSNLEVTTEPTGADDIVMITVDGDVTGSVNGDSVPIGPLLIDKVFDGERPDMSMEPTDDQVGGANLAVVERDGRWYLSLFYSVAESTRGDAEVPSAGVRPKGADSPEAAVDQVLTAVQDLNLERLIASLDPTEMEALQRYAPLFLDDAQAQLDDAGIVWSIDDRNYTVEGSGTRRHVGIDSLNLTADLAGEAQFSLGFADGCATFTVDGESTTSCADDFGGLDDLLADSGLADDTAIRDLVDAVGSAFADYDPRGIAVHQVGGEWFVSPLRTGFDFYNDYLAALDRDELAAIIDAVRAVGNSVSLGGVLDDDMVLDDGIVLDDGTSGSDPGMDAMNQCYEQADEAGIVQCMNDGIAAGVIDPTFVPVTTRFPECGVAEMYWNEVYSLPDESFTEMVTAASPCFLDLIATGAVDSFEVPYELIAPGCTEGLNWYTSSDTDYTDRFFACAEQVRLGL